MRPRIRSHLLGPYEEWLEARWQSGYQVGQQLWQELKELGYKGSRNTVARWAAKRRAGHNPQAPERQQTRDHWKATTRRTEAGRGGEEGGSKGKTREETST